MKFASCAIRGGNVSFLLLSLLRRGRNLAGISLIAYYLCSANFIGSTMIFSGNQLRRFGVAALLVAPTVGFGVATAATAQACSVSAHCYGEAY